MNSFVTGLINAASLRPDVKTEEIVANVDERTFEGDELPTAILCFESGRKVSLNQKRLRAMIAAFGPNDSNWEGKKVLLHRGTDSFQGRVVDAVALEPVIEPRAHRIDAPAERSRLRSIQRHEEPPPPSSAAAGAGEALDDDIPF
jgi:hypothetical protein